MQIRNRIKELRQVKASELLPNPKNWRRHPTGQADALRGALAEIGYADALIAYESPDGLMLIDGHLRAETTPDMEVPVLVTDLDEGEADKLLATLDPLSAMAEQDNAALGSLLENMATRNDDLSHMLEQMQDDMSMATLEIARDSLKRERRMMSDRTLPIDMVISVAGGGPYCCIAVVAGLKYGKMSGSSVSACHEMYQGKHNLIFIDNEYRKYNHQLHLNYVKQHRPKYATVRDVMTQSQCKQEGVAYYSLEQILDFGDELNEYADNVIVIPKYDCLDKIPERFMLGYSIPTSYGGTPLPLDAFAGRNVHLLGGSWNQQRRAMEVLGDDIKSADNNQVLLLARYGAWSNADGSTTSASHMFGAVSNIAIIAFTISCGGIAAGIKELLGQEVTQVEQEVNDDAIRV